MKARKILATVLAICLMAFVLSGCAATGGGEAAGSGSMISSLVMIAMIFVVFYFFMIKPEKKRKQQAQEMRDSISVGDKITTIGGMVGRVVHVSDDKLTFETGEDRVRIEVTKWAVSSNEGRGSKEKSDSEETLET